MEVLVDVADTNLMEDAEADDNAVVVDTVVVVDGKKVVDGIVDGKGVVDGIVDGNLVDGIVVDEVVVVDGVGLVVDGAGVVGDVDFVDGGVDERSTTAGLTVDRGITDGGKLVDGKGVVDGGDLDVDDPLTTRFFVDGGLFADDGVEIASEKDCEADLTGIFAPEGFSTVGRAIFSFLAEDCPDFEGVCLAEGLSEESEDLALFSP